MLGSKRVARTNRRSEKRLDGGRKRRVENKRSGERYLRDSGGETRAFPFLRLFYDERHCQRRIFITVTAESAVYTPTDACFSLSLSLSLSFSIYLFHRLFFNETYKSSPDIIASHDALERKVVPQMIRRMINIYGSF